MGWPEGAPQREHRYDYIQRVHSSGYWLNAFITHKTTLSVWLHTISVIYFFELWRLYVANFKYYVHSLNSQKKKGLTHSVVFLVENFFGNWVCAVLCLFVKLNVNAAHLQVFPTR